MHAVAVTWSMHSQHACTAGALHLPGAKQCCRAQPCGCTTYCTGYTVCALRVQLVASSSTPFRCIIVDRSSGSLWFQQGSAGRPQVHDLERRQKREAEAEERKRARKAEHEAAANERAAQSRAQDAAHEQQLQARPDAAATKLQRPCVYTYLV